MKNIALFVLSIFFATAVAAQDNKAAIVGTWKHVSTDKTELDAAVAKLNASAKKKKDKEDAAMFEMGAGMMAGLFKDVTLVFKADGKLEIISKGRTENATYTIEGDNFTFTQKGSKVSFTIVSLADGKLQLKDSFFLLHNFDKQ